MKKVIISGLVLICLFLISGCVDKTIKPFGNGICEEEEYGKISADCPHCDDYNEFTKDEFDFEKQECEYTRLTKQEIVTKCTGEYYYEEEITRCLKAASLALEDVSLCENILGKKAKENCIFGVALKLEDVSICRNWWCIHITDNYLKQLCFNGGGYSKICIKSYAENKIDYSACEMMNNEASMRGCFGIVYKASNKYATETCEGVSAQYKELCLDAFWIKYS